MIRRGKVCGDHVQIQVQNQNQNQGGNKQGIQ